jgi:hypothetical protein
MADIYIIHDQVAESADIIRELEASNKYKTDTIKCIFQGGDYTPKVTDLINSNIRKGILKEVNAVTLRHGSSDDQPWPILWHECVNAVVYNFGPQPVSLVADNQSYTLNVGDVLVAPSGGIMVTLMSRLPVGNYLLVMESDPNA